MSIHQRQPWKHPIFYNTLLNEKYMATIQDQLQSLRSPRCDWSIILSRLAPNKRVMAKHTIETRYWDMYKTHCHNHPVIYNDQNQLAFLPATPSSNNLSNVMTNSSLSMQAKLNQFMAMGITLDYFADLVETLSSGSEDETHMSIDIEH